MKNKSEYLKMIIRLTNELVGGWPSQDFNMGRLVGGCPNLSRAYTSFVQAQPFPRPG